MAHRIEGTPVHGFRVIDDEVGALTARLRTEAAALEAAGVKVEKPAKKAAAKSAK